VLPFFGPSTLRDGVGQAIDIYADPLTAVRPIPVRTAAYTLRFTGNRADLLDAGRLLEEAALDRYVFLRDAYLQRRRNLVYDGEPPRDRRQRYEEEDEKAQPDKPSAQPDKPSTQ